VFVGYNGPVAANPATYEKLSEQQIIG